MKKFGKFLFSTLSIASIAAGAYYVYKNILKKDDNDDFDDFDDEFDDDLDEFVLEDEYTDENTEAREYVSINITSDEPEEELSQDNEVSEDEVSEQSGE